jgi:hypothetical protein
VPDVETNKNNEKKKLGHVPWYSPKKTSTDAMTANGL